MGSFLRYRNGTIYEIPLKFSEEGLYYIHIYSDKKEMEQNRHLSIQKGKTLKVVLSQKQTRITGCFIYLTLYRS